MMGWLWTLITIVGPILLIAAIVYAWWRNKTAGPANVQTAERGAVELREEIRRDPEYKEE
jgi:hypothetical protein